MNARTAMLVVVSGSLASIASADTVVDLTTNGQTGTIRGAIFSNAEEHAAGTGLIDSFVRIQTNDNVEDGYNTNARPLGRDENNSPFTHDLTLGQVPVLTVGATSYYQFQLDINQTHSDPLLSLDNVRIFTRDTALTSYRSNLSNLGTLRYNMDGGAGDNNRVHLNYALQEGSGTGDMAMLVPVSLFNGAGPGTFVYLYSMFGAFHNNNDGFEEWFVESPVVIPLPSAAGAGLASLIGLGAIRGSRRRR